MSNHGHIKHHERAELGLHVERLKRVEHCLSLQYLMAVPISMVTELYQSGGRAECHVVVRTFAHILVFHLTLLFRPKITLTAENDSIGRN